MSCHGERHVQPPRADGQHAEPCGRRGVRVGSQKGGPRHAEALQVHLVRDPVARLGEMDPESLRRAGQKGVVVGVLVVGLQQVVVHVLSRQVDLDPVDAGGHELQHRHGAGGVLQECLIYL